jgi:MoxR-like ATPase
MFSIEVGYPSEAEEIEIVRRTMSGASQQVQPVVSREKLLELQDLIRRMPSSEAVDRMAVRLARATRPSPDAPSAVNEWVQWGAGPRASQYLSLGARVWAALHGNEVPSLDDVVAVAPSVLSHRLLVNFQAEAQGIRAQDVIQAIFEAHSPKELAR